MCFTAVVCSHLQHAGPLVFANFLHRHMSKLAQPFLRVATASCLTVKEADHLHLPGGDGPGALMDNRGGGSGSL